MEMVATKYVLIASLFWHRLACVDPSSQFLSEVQAILMNFFWDKLHWVPQSNLYLPKEEGGQGLIYLKISVAAFHLQFLQRFLDGSTNCSWHSVSGTILCTLGGFLDKPLFLIDPTQLDLSELPIFYQNLFKVWSFFFFFCPSDRELFFSPVVITGAIDTWGQLGHYSMLYPTRIQYLSSGIQGFNLGTFIV